MSNCLNCGEHISQTLGKREKQFCDSTCRSNYWQKKKRTQKLQLEVKEESKKRKNPLINAAKGRDKNGVNKDESILSDFEKEFQNIINKKNGKQTS